MNKLSDLHHKQAGRPLAIPLILVSYAFTRLPVLFGLVASLTLVCGIRGILMHLEAARVRWPGSIPTCVPGIGGLLWRET